MIRQEYKDQLVEQRDRNEYWGGSAVRNAGDHVLRYLTKHTNIHTVLDFGSGLGTLGLFVEGALDRDVEWTNYDPSIPGKDKLPEGMYDLIVSTDVMEHVEPCSQAETLKFMHERSVRQFHHIDCNETNDRLADGRDVHLIIRPPQWWEDTLLQANPGFILMHRSDIYQRKRGRYPRTSCTFILERNT